MLAGPGPDVVGDAVVGGSVGGRVAVVEGDFLGRRVAGDPAAVDDPGLGVAVPGAEEGEGDGSQDVAVNATPATNTTAATRLVRGPPVGSARPRTSRVAIAFTVGAFRVA